MGKAKGKAGQRAQTISQELAEVRSKQKDLCPSLISCVR